MVEQAGLERAEHRRGLWESGTWEWSNVVALVVETWPVRLRVPRGAYQEAWRAWVLLGAPLLRS